MSAAVDVHRKRRVPMIAASPGVSPSTGRPAGLSRGELTHPWRTFTAAGGEVEIVSPAGGDPVADGYSGPEDASGRSACTRSRAVRAARNGGPVRRASARSAIPFAATVMSIFSCAAACAVPGAGVAAHPPGPVRPAGRRRVRHCASLRPRWRQTASTGAPSAVMIGSTPSPGASEARIRPFTRRGAPVAMSLVP